ncbi:MAG: hypothetical protein ABIQ32_07790 [Sphingomicrobium sp.]
MRRVGSIILFVLGGWLLSTEAMMAWMTFSSEMTIGMKLAMSGFFLAFAAPFLLGGTWASPGKRKRELGLTLMISAAVGLGLGLVMFMVTNDPGFAKALPPGQAMPEFGIDPLFGALNLVVVAGLGLLLWWGGALRDPNAELGRVFD